MPGSEGFTQIQMNDTRTTEERGDEVSNVSFARSVNSTMLAFAPCWDKAIPPAMVEIETWRDTENGMSGSRPKWNPVWLNGLEEFVRAVVRDELSKGGIER